MRRAALASVLVLVVASVRAAQPAAQPHAPPDVPASVAGWAVGARLFDRLGDFHRPIGTRVPQAQQYFDQGMRLLWAFNHDEATRSFAQAVQLDPGCAICDWGVALAVGPNYNLPRLSAARLAVANEALTQARAHAATAQPVERALIEALAARYALNLPLGPDNIAQANESYARAMRAVAEQYGEDLDVQTLYAAAQMEVHPWQLWSPNGVAGPDTRALAARLEAVLARAPLHPGANHYYIHLMEASPHPERALASAERLKGMMPAAGHLEHMPAHIFERLGRYEDAAQANRSGIAADQAYFASTRAPDSYAHYLAHNYAFLAYAAAMEGRKAETLQAVQGVLASLPASMAHGADDSGWDRTGQYSALVRFGLWDELIALAAPPPESPGERLGYLWARGVALAARGQTTEAESTLAALRALAEQLKRTPPADSHLLEQLFNIAQPIVVARIAASANRNAEAVALLQQAVAAEDALPYSEPALWFFPVRHLLGAQLLIAQRPKEAERVYREDLRRAPHNGWALLGLAGALAAEKHAAAAARAQSDFIAAWRLADVRLVGSAFWFAGADHTSCECQRQDLTRAAGGS
jgi:tetratricopeptide (TPR) repeat protein